MNKSIVALGVGLMAGASYVILNLVLEKMGFKPYKSRRLDDVLQEILDLLPLQDLKTIISTYAMFSKETSDAIRFINDSRKYLVSEFQQIPEVRAFSKKLQECGVDVNTWSKKLEREWRILPTFVSNESDIAHGGIDELITKLSKTMPLVKINDLLLERAKYSQGLRNFIEAIRSKEFLALCQAIQSNKVLLRHYHWAKDAKIEVEPVLILFAALHDYFAVKLLPLPPQPTSRRQ